MDTAEVENFLLHFLNPVAMYQALALRAFLSEVLSFCFRNDKDNIKKT